MTVNTASECRTATDQPPVMTLPGNAVGAGRAVTVGLKEFFPCGPGVSAPGTDFSDGDTGAVADGLDGMGVSVGFSFVPQAVNIPRPTRALAPAARAIRRASGTDIMIVLLRFWVKLL